MTTLNDYVALDADHGRLKKAVLDYLSEFDNPVPDYGYRRTLRNQLRELVGAPKESPPTR